MSLRAAASIVALSITATAAAAPETPGAPAPKAVAPRAASPKPAPPKAPPPKAAPPAAPKPTDPQRRLLEDAYDDYVHGNYAAAIDHARRIEPPSMAARKIIAASACFLHDREAAHTVWEHLLPGRDRAFVKYICARNGIDIETGRDATGPAPPPDATQLITLDDDTPASLLSAAQQHYADARYLDAIDAARRSDPRGRDPKAWRVIGAASCKLDDKAGVMSAWRRLKAKADRQFLRYACARSQVRLP